MVWPCWLVWLRGRYWNNCWLLSIITSPPLLYLFFCWLVYSCPHVQQWSQVQSMVSSPHRASTGNLEERVKYFYLPAAFPGMPGESPVHIPCRVSQVYPPWPLCTPGYILHKCLVEASICQALWPGKDHFSSMT